MDPESRLLADRVVPGPLWQAVAPVIPRPLGRPQGGGRGRRDDRVVFTTIVLAVTAGVSWRAAGGAFGVPASTVHRRFVEWSVQGLWPRLARAEGLPDPALRSWLSAIAGAAQRRHGHGDSPHDPAPVAGAAGWTPSTAGASV